MTLKKLIIIVLIYFVIRFENFRETVHFDSFRFEIEKSISHSPN